MRFLLLVTIVEANIALLHSEVSVSLVAGAGHPAAHSGSGSLTARSGGLPGAAHAGTHPAQEASGDA